MANVAKAMHSNHARFGVLFHVSKILRSWRGFLRKVTLARGGALSPYSGLGGAHASLAQRLKSGLIEGYQLMNEHEYNITKNPFSRVWKRWFRGPSNVAKLSKQCDILHISDQEQAGLVPKGGTSVVTVHDLFHLYPQVQDGIEIGDQHPSLIRKRDLNKIKQGLANASLLICISKETQKQCEIHFPGIPTAWIPHGIDLNQYNIETERPSWFNKGVNLLVIGSEEPRKRVEFAVEVCSGMDVTLHKIGAESSMSSKQNLIATAKTSDCNLNWVGRLEQGEMIAALQHADALLFPSIAEGFGLPPLEAYASGTVALVADAPAHNEIPLKHHVLPPNDVNAWRTAISQLTDESTAVKERAAVYSIEHWAKRHQEAYDSLF
jgi:glycosyltransferase involved in cell wall biosynthesis